jgi:hypothetical protein
LNSDGRRKIDRNKRQGATREKARKGKQKEER